MTDSRRALEISLAYELARRVPRPIDMLEISAVLESMGITDAVAHEDHDQPSVFALAERLLPSVRIIAAGQPAPLEVRREEPPRELVATKMVMTASARGVLALLPLLLVASSMQALAMLGWSSRSVFALSFGLTAAMVLTTGPLLAIARRASIYLGFGYRALAQGFLARSLLTMIVATMATAAGLFLVLTLLGSFRADDRGIFAGSLAAFALLWLLIAGVAIAGSSTLVGIGLFAGLGVGAATGAASQSVPLGLAYAYSASVAFLAAASIWLLTAPNEPGVRVPGLGTTLLEGLAYARYGAAFGVLLLEPHVLGWLGARGDLTRLSVLTTVELSFSLALPPLLLATGVLERAMRSFWPFAQDRHESETGKRFCASLGGFHRRRQVAYVATVAGFGLIVAAVFEAAFYAGELRSADQLVVLAALTSFLLLAVGQFNCLFLLGFSRPNEAFAAVAYAVAALTALGVPLTLVDFRYATVGFLVACGVFAAVSDRAWTAVCARADYHYATAF